MTEAPSKEELEALHCWDANDRVPGQPEMTDFRRRLRYRQARWREANGHPLGSQPIAPKPGGSARLVGSRLPLGYARERWPPAWPARAGDPRRPDERHPEVRGVLRRWATTS